MKHKQIKKVTVLAMLLLSIISSMANTTSDITNVIVYQRGARVTREANVKLQPGNNEIVLSNLTNSIDANSVQVKIMGDAILLSATSFIKTLENKDIPVRTKTLTDSIAFIDKHLGWLSSQKSVYQGEEKIILDNKQLGTAEEQISVDELIKLSEFYRNRLLDIRENIYKIDSETDNWSKKKEKMNAELYKLRHKEKQTIGEVVINISSKIAQTQKILVSYLTYQAGWTPLYDVRAKGANEPLNLIYKANVYQSTGLNWEKINLTISTGNPTANIDRPILYPWHIDFVNSWDYNNGPELKKKAAMSENMYQRSMAPEMLALEDEEKEKPIIAYDVKETTSRIAAEYKIDISQDIPSDGKNHIVAMKQYELSSKFTYHSVPKLDKGAYLLAKVADYGNFNLLPGPSNLFFDGMYIGQSYLNPITTVDSMLLSLGQDNKITVKRTQLQDLTAKQVIGTNVKEYRGYEISVRNNNNFPIEIEIMDQLPISNNKDIEVKEEEISNAEYDVDYGSLLWKIQLKPGETKMVKFAYSVKYPKGMSISNL